jgi:hypothetical protein
MDSVNRGNRRNARLWGLAALSVGAVMAVSGCIKIQATPEIIYITPAPASATPAPATPAPTLAPTADASGSVSGPAAPTVASETINKTASDSRWTLTFRKPVVAGASSDAVAAMNASIGTRVDGYIAAFETGELPVVVAGDAPSSLRGDYSVAYLSANLVCLRFSVQKYTTGAASTSAVAGSLNLNATTGAAIRFEDLFTSTGAALPVLTSQAHTLLTAGLGSDLAWPSSVTIADFQNAWVITAEGLELTWSQGAVAAQAAGTPSISIPWSALRTVISPTGPAGSFVA